MKLLMIIVAWIPGLTLVCFIVSCEEKSNGPSPVVPQFVSMYYTFNVVDKKEAIYRGTFMGERLACGTVDCPPILDSFALRHHCRVNEASNYAIVFLSEDGKVNKLALAKESCECFVMTYAIIINGFAKDRAKLMAKIRCNYSFREEIP